NFAFTERQRPSSCMALRADPVAVLGKLTIKPLATMRPTPTNLAGAAGKAIELQIKNVRSGRSDVAMTVELEKRPRGKTLQQIGDDLIGQLALPRETEVRWKPVEGPTPRILSSSFPGARKSGG